jgi:hypothetical protein
MSTHRYQLTGASCIVLQDNWAVRLFVPSQRTFAFLTLPAPAHFSH